MYVILYVVLVRVKLEIVMLNYSENEEFENDFWGKLFYLVGGLENFFFWINWFDNVFLLKISVEVLC